MTSVLFVCTANICRSPLAEALWRHRGFQASSAGVAARNGLPMHELSLAELRRRGVPAAPQSGDSSGSQPGTSRLATAREIREADVVLCMEAEHRAALTRIAPAAIAKTFTLPEYAAILRDHPGSTPREAHRKRRGYQESDIADPIGGTAEDFKECADRIDALLDVIGQHMA
ncbi:arsenate reductase/protein-tyrosine-phosphatase family protein [Corynebacterium gerontici]|uniref:Low molecular weight protein-tyrosine-phosphatase etp n=1 Tax=Corynebacterium gerontici TaxID=2079234 RepID=A0A3G6IXD2_9CORY|nr:hypothetical protein [Corynebacterium gerontici]AZA10425.1 Low molecular weight protein-tyrosine-phosphatase etp [Corynebacterium gerontici]